MTASKFSILKSALPIGSLPTEKMAKRFNSIFLILVFCILTTGCSFLSNVFDYKHLCEATIKKIIDERYDELVPVFGVDAGDTAKVRQLTNGIKDFRSVLVDNFGSDFSLWYMGSEKTLFSTTKDVPDITKVSIQIESETHYGVIRFTIDDKSGSIQWINLDNTRKPIPDTTLFWLFAILPLGILCFNVYTIQRAAKSRLKKKWIFIVICIILNIPSLECAMQYPVLNFNANLSLQMLFGVSFNLMGYDNYALGFGVPIGSIISHYYIVRKKREYSTPDLTGSKG
jgi:hypothetical protein